MLIVVRPKSQEHICVEAYLETAHLLRAERLEPAADSSTSRPWNFLRVDNIGGEGKEAAKPSKYADKNQIEFHKKATQTFTVPDGYVIDTSRGDPNIAGVHVESMNSGLSEFTFDIQPDHVTLNVDVIGMFTPRGYKWINSFFELSSTIYLKTKPKASDVKSFDDTLLITGRAVCSCARDIRRSLPYEKDMSVVYEKQLAQIEPRSGRKGEALSIHDANRLGAHVHREMVQSLSSADRYPRGMAFSTRSSSLER
jgi:hypothetical protein